MTLMKQRSKVKAKSCQKVINLDEYMPKDSNSKKKVVVRNGNGRQRTDNKWKVVE